MIKEISKEKILSSIAEIARQGRCESLHKFDSSKQRYQELELIKKIIPIVDDFSEKGKLIEVIADFAFDALNQEKTIHSVSLFHRPNGESKPVYMALSENGTPLVILKAFPILTAMVGDFIRELSGMDLIASLQLIHSQPILPLAVGKCVVDETGYLLLAESFAFGDRLIDIIDQVIAGQENQLERLTEACFFVGKALSEMHAKAQGELGCFPRYFLEHICMSFSLDLKRMKTLPGGLEQQRVVNYFDWCLSKAEKVKYPYVFSHGDATIHNLFFNHKSQLLSFIDSPETHMSVGQQGNPMGSAARDVVSFLESLERYLAAFQRDDLAESLVKAFRKGYLSYVKEFPPSEICQILEVCNKVWVLSNNVGWEKIKNPKEKQIAHNLYKHSLNYLKDAIS